MNDLFSTEIFIEERTEKKTKHHDYQCNVSIGKKNLFTEETQNMQDKKINVSRVSNVK